MKRKIASMFLLIMLLSALAVPVGASSAGSYSDVGANDWFATAAVYCVANGLMNGVSSASFEPYQPMTRAQFITILGRMDGVTKGSVAITGQYSDVPDGAYYACYVYWAGENGIVSGTTDTTFSPDDPITRQQMAALMDRYLTYKNTTLENDSDAAPPFSDLETAGSYARSGIETLRTCGLLKGNAGKVQPQKKLNRAEGATVLMRLREKLLAAGVSLGSGRAYSGLSALHVEGTKLVNDSGEVVQLRGISTHGLAWYPQYINEDCFAQLHDEFRVDVIRLALYTQEYGGYCSGGDQDALKYLIDKGVRYATDNDMYVILDWHILSDGNPNTHLAEAKTFFAEMAATYADYNNVLYEICNEPNGGTTWTQIKSYAEAVIPAIRAKAPNSVIIVGTPNWSQEVDKAAADPLTGCGNVMYALHFYADTHTDALRNTLTAAVQAGLPVFVTEYGICNASGQGSINTMQADKWVSLLDSYDIGYVAWNLSNKAETCAIFNSACTKTSGFSSSDLSASGQWFLQTMTGKDTLSGARKNENPVVAYCAQ